MTDPKDYGPEKQHAVVTAETELEAVREELEQWDWLNEDEPLICSIAALCDARNELARELHAVRVLDAWSKKHTSSWAVDFLGEHEGFICLGAHFLSALDSDDEFAGTGKTAALARIAAAEALLKEDPSLGSEV